MKKLFALLLSLPVLAIAAEKTPNAHLPKVLVIGDSISMNYHEAAKAALAGIADYQRINENAGPSTNGIAKVEKWIGSTKWDIIQFNHGLHDLKTSYDANTKTWGPNMVSLEDYKINLGKEIDILKKTGARLIWCTTTPVPNDNTTFAPRQKGSSEKYNAAALEVLKLHPEITITDLHATVSQSPVFDQWRTTQDVHFYKKEEQKMLGDTVASTIRSLIDKPKKNLPMPGEVFLVEGHTAFVILPPQRDPAKPTPWIWYAPTLQGLPSNAEKWMFEKFLAAGVGIGGVDVGESMGNPKGRAGFTAYYNVMTSKYNMSKKPCMVGRSRGGLMNVNWASETPKSIAAIGGIYPVCNLASWPGLGQACNAYGVTEKELSAQLGQHNPIERLAPLAAAGIPIMHIHGDKDHLVPLEKNSGLIKERYDKLGGTMILEIIPGGGHDLNKHWFQNQNLIDFLIKHATAQP